MNKWIIAGVLYVAVVFGGFQLYDKWSSGNKSSSARMDMNSNQMEKNANHGNQVESGMSHMHESGAAHDSEVNTYVENDEKQIIIFLKDKTGNPIDDLEVNHEKLMHFIIVDDHMQKYYHLHPKKTGKGEFTISNDLPDGFYKAYIDIKPKNEAYMVEPVPFVVGHPTSSEHGYELTPDAVLSKRIEGETVKLNVNTFKAGQPVTLSFNLDQTNLTPYLGAIGHVVILDEFGKTYLHVHPVNNDEPVFETEFEKPGIYKIWAEFKQNGKVRAFPFVIKIEK